MTAAPSTVVAGRDPRRELRRSFWQACGVLVLLAAAGRTAIHVVHREHTSALELGLSAASVFVLMPVVIWLLHRRFVRIVGAALRAEESAKAEAERSRMELERVVDAILDPIASIDEQGRILSVNPAVERVFGWPREELLGRNVSVLMGEPYRREHDGYIAHYLRTGDARAIGRVRKVLGRRRDGTEFPCELSVSEIRGPGAKRRFVGVVRDISEREQIAARLAHTERLAALGELAATVAHEVNNPVNTIINCAQLVKDGDDDPQLLQHITEEGVRIASIVRDLLDFARDRHDENSTVHVGDVVRRTLSLSQGRIEKHGIRLRVDLAPDLPALRARSQQLQQVLLNLLLNARDALVGDGRSSVQPGKEIAIRAEPAGNGVHRMIRLSVRDNGPGIAPENLERVFQPFFTTKADRGGNGLGLAVSRGIVQEHGGTLTVRSEPGEFCEFIVELPVREEDAPDHGADRADR